ncbi:MAG: DNA recombination protein RmuC [Flavobacteriales bacterium]|jgi:DNA recombination protein RmuC
MLYLYIIGSFVLGVIFAAIFLYFKLIRLKDRCQVLGQELIRSEKNSDSQKLEGVNLSNSLSDYKVKASELSSINNLMISSIEKRKEEVTLLRDKLSDALVENASLIERQINLKESITFQKKEVLTMKDSFTKEFENLANRILDEKTLKFTEQNKNNLKEILSPFDAKIQEFKGAVEKSNYSNSKERIELAEHIKQLVGLNSAMQKETKNLTKALKGDNKTQGNWGEVVLERVLECSGLVKDREYFTQQSFNKEEEAGFLRPDVIIRLPESKSLVIDSKVSLTAYNQLINSEDKEDRELALKSHVISIRNHINSLAGKNYQFANGVNTPDFVLLFMPIESSFSIATQSDQDLFEYAWSRKIVMVSPSTLLATLKTIASVWKNDHQNKNAMEIAERAGKLYDKFVSFVDDLEKVGKSLKIAEESYDKAFSKLKDGRGNAISIAQKIVELGAKPKKSLPDHLV